jgi:polysaccharide biosynthesis protein PslH
MKILAVSGRIPAPGRKGDQVVSFFRLMHLARTHEIEVVCFGDANKPDDRAAMQTLEAAGIALHLVRWKPLVAFIQLLSAIPNKKKPFQCAFFTSSEFQSVVNQAIKQFNPDALYCVMVRMINNIDGYDGPMFLEMVDSMGLNFSRRVSLAKGPKRWLLQIEQERVSAYERWCATERARKSFVVSSIDQEAIDTHKVDVIKLGIDLAQFKKETHLGSAPVIAFTGNMNYKPNIDAVTWFVNYCWNEIKTEIPEVRLIIAGGGPPASVLEFSKNDPGITVTGRVASIADILNGANVAIAPMQSGSGMQFKILEAMACGVPIVTTSLGLGDISATPEKELLVADTAAEFQKSVLRLIRSKELSSQIGDNGMRFVQVNHSWDSLNEEFTKACQIK